MAKFIFLPPGGHLRLSLFFCNQVTTCGIVYISTTRGPLVAYGATDLTINRFMYVFIFPVDQHY